MSSARPDCILWEGTTNAGGYGQMKRYVAGKRRTLLAHRVSYERARGPIPAGLELDHLCRVRRCVNPAHLEAVSHAENVRRGEGVAALNARLTHCRRGHPFDQTNTKRYAGRRYCRACRTAWEHQHRSPRPE